MGMQLARDEYDLTRSFPKDELYGMTSQIRRASVSVPANIAEGYGRDSSGDYARFLQIAQGTLKELKTLLMLAQEIGLTSGERVTPLLETTDRIGRTLRSLI